MGALLVGLLGKVGSAFTGPIGWLIDLFLEFVWGKIVAWYKGYEKDKQEHSDQVAQADQDMKKTESISDSSSTKEQEDAANDAFKHL